MARDFPDDNLLHHQPVNRNAHSVLKPGVGWTPDRRTAHLVYSRDPLPVRPPSNGLQHSLIGKRVGRMVVIGVSVLKRPDGSRYVVKCACGMYETRTATAIRNPKEKVDCCHECRTIANRRAGRHHTETGEWKPPEEFL